MWTCNSKASINKLRLNDENSKPELVIKLLDDDKPRGIDVDSCNQ